MQYHSSTQYYGRSFLKTTGWKKMKHMLLPIYHNGVSCVRSAACTCNNVVVSCKDVHGFSFPFISPLRADNGGYLAEGREEFLHEVRLAKRYGFEK